MNASLVATPFTEADVRLLSDIAQSRSTVDHYDRLDVLRKVLRAVVHRGATAFTGADVSLLADIAGGYSPMRHYEDLSDLCKRIAAVVRTAGTNAVQVCLPATGGDEELRDALARAVVAGWEALPSIAQDALRRRDSDVIPEAWRLVVRAILVEAVAELPARPAVTR